MTDNILKFTGLTTLPLAAEDILEAAKKADLQECIIIGIHKGEFDEHPLYIAGTTSDMALVNLLIDHAKLELLETRGSRRTL